MKRQILLKTALLSSVAMAFTASMSASVYAQDADEEVEQVVVTGSRIVRKDLQAASPVTVLNAEEVTYTGTTRIEDLVTSLPQAFAAQNSTAANGASGTATVALRHLGSTRTLVLINGRRAAAGDPFASAFDMNFIPTQLVKRVEVLTGGASSVYGADAVAGVVNFILDTDFEGLKLDAQYSFYQHNNDNELMQRINEDRGFTPPKGNITDGKTKTLAMAAGSSFADGRGHASAYVSYRNIGSIVKAGRDYTNCSLGRGPDGPRCGGSSTSAMGRFIVPGVGDFVLDWNGPGNTFTPRDGEVFNFGPFNHIQRPDTKWAGGGFLKYQVNDNVEAYLETMFMDDYTRAQIAPSGNFGRTSSINCGNPMLSASQFDIICTQSGATGAGINQATYLAGLAPLEEGERASLTILRRNVEGGNRTNVIRHTSYRIVSGFRGQLDDTWSFDIYGQHSVNLASESYINDLNVSRLTNALNVVTDANGNAVCSTDVGNGCVPWNLFTKGAVTEEALAYIKTTAVMNGFTKSQIVSGNVVGNLGDYGVVTPWADEGTSVVFGAEYRKESLTTTPDEVFEKGLRAGGGGRTVAYDVDFNVKDLFAEAIIPLVQGSEMAEDLSLELAARYSEHNITGGATTYKVAMTWTPVPDIKFRGGYNRAIRAPGLVNFFAPQNTGLGGNDDICANDPSTGLPKATAAECALTGVSAAQYGTILPNPANQYNTLTGGNPNLKPEIADTYTLGVVYTPESVPGLSITVDYYKIDINDTIGSLGADDIIQTCATTGDAGLCSLIHRDSLGTLWLSSDAFTETTQQNIGKLGAEGIDVNMQYNASLGEYGDLNIALIGTYLLGSTFQNPLTSYDCVGYFGAQCGSPDARWRSRTRVTWQTTFDTDISVSWRFIGASTNDDFSPDPDIGSSSASNLNAWIVNGADRISGRSVYDIAISHNVTEAIRATIGVNNIADSEPPLLPGLTSTGFSAAYDTLGRYMFFGVKADF